MVERCELMRYHSHDVLREQDTCSLSLNSWAFRLCPYTGHRSHANIPCSITPVRQLTPPSTSTQQEVLPNPSTSLP